MGSEGSTFYWSVGNVFAPSSVGFDRDRQVSQLPSQGQDRPLSYQGHVSLRAGPWDTPDSGNISARAFAYSFYGYNEVETLPLHDQRRTSLSYLPPEDMNTIIASPVGASRVPKESRSINAKTEADGKAKRCIHKWSPAFTSSPGHPAQLSPPIHERPTAQNQAQTDFSLCAKHSDIPMTSTTGLSGRREYPVQHCSICRKQYHGRCAPGNLQRHRATNHRTVNSKQPQCVHCGKVFKRTDNVQRHERSCRLRGIVASS